MTVKVEKKEAVTTVIIDRPDRKNAIDWETAEGLLEAFKEFDKKITSDEPFGIMAMREFISKALTKEEGK